jgi:hypothetical protein
MLSCHHSEACLFLLSGIRGRASEAAERGCKKKETEERSACTHMRRHKDLHRSQDAEESQLSDLFDLTIHHLSLDGLHHQRLVMERELGFAGPLDDLGTGLKGL